MENFIAGIVTFNPNLDRLKENINAVCNQVERVVVVDNGSTSINEINEIISEYNNITLIPLQDNLGIAIAQNKICEYAKEFGYEWAITLDQDSVSPQNLVSEYSRLIDHTDIGMLCPKIIDRNFGELDYAQGHSGIEEVEQCIASASAIRISAWDKVGGFYGPLFIDSVDYDICWSLREADYKIVKINGVRLLHEVGHSIVVRFAGKERQIYNHSPLRYYYMVRNRIIVGRRHHRRLKSLKYVIRLIFQVNKYETNRWAKDKMMAIGLLHGIIDKKGKYE